MILTDSEAIKLIESPANSASIQLGAELQDSHKVHVTGDGYEDYIKKILGYENNEQYAQKKELSEAVTTVLTRRIIDEQSRWKNTSGPKQDFDFKGGKHDKKLNKILSQVWKGESMKYFVNNFLAESLYTEFNGFLLVEQAEIIEENGKIFEVRDGVKSLVKNNETYPYIIFRPIEGIHDFQSRGNRVEYIILDWGKEKRGETEVQLYRVIDDMWDRIFETDEEGVKISRKYKKIANNLGLVPAVQISTFRKSPADDYVKVSPIWQTLPLLKTYLTNWAEHVITCILHSHPIYYQVGQRCRYSDDRGECDNGYINYTIDGVAHRDVCPACNGVGASIQKDASTMIILPQVDEQGQPYNISNVAGYVAPPVEGIKSQREGLKELADQIMQSGTGMNRVMETSIEKTATEAVLNYKPLEKIISGILSNIEYVQTALTDMIGSLFFGDKYIKSEIVYSRNLNLRDENTVLLEIEQAKEAGASASYVRTLHDELIHSRYQNSPVELERNMMLSQLEPFIGYTPKDLADSFAGFIDDATMTMKVYFTDYIVRFENENVKITDYKEDQDMNVRIEEIKKIITIYNDEMLSKVRAAKLTDSNIQSPGDQA